MKFLYFPVPWHGLFEEFNRHFATYAIYERFLRRFFFTIVKIILNDILITLSDRYSCKY